MDKIQVRRKYIDLQAPCQTLIATGKCLGCTALENPEFTGNKNCKYAKEKEWENITIEKQ